MKFTYRSGQRPLDGYTLKRGVGQGGFGEVYFAVADSGKEVALKLLHRSPDAELRGIAHCLNLKHPNLVHLFDLRTDDRGDHWVVMEYVFGESLAQWINRYPTGLPVDLVKEWFGALCRGVGYLHDNGVVHRDLKPANVFIEGGHLKVGDYGLARRVSISQGGDMSQGVGTPNYMAPEIKGGNYTQSIDLYALGVILFEMLCGSPPFDGQTPGEVMMKHLTDKPDLARAPEAFRPVLARALDKDPHARFPTVRDLAKAVDAVGTPAAPAAPAVPAPPAASTVVMPPAVVPPRAVPVAMPVHPADRRFASGPIPATYRGRLNELAGSVALVPVVAAACTAPWALIAPAEPWALVGRVFLLSSALSWAVLVVARPLPVEGKTAWGRRFHLLLAGMAVGLLAFWLDGWAVGRTGSPADTSRDLVLANGLRVGPDTLSVGMRYVFYYGLAAAMVRWWRLADRRRRERFRFLPILTAGVWAGAFLFLWPWEAASPALAVAPLVIAAVCVQVASPWAAPAAQTRPVARPVAAYRRRRGHWV